MIADRSRLRVMLASVARTLHVGLLADCFFDPATALCHKRVTTPDPKQPLTALCEPTRCPNACITARHRPAWERAADDARALLRERRLSDLQRHALATEINRLTTVIDAIGPAPPEANPRTDARRDGHAWARTGRSRGSPNL